MPNMRVVTFAIGALLWTCATGAQAQNEPSCASSIRVLFSQYGMTHVPTGSTLWFTAVLKSVRNANGSAITTPTRIEVRQSRITFGKWSHVINMPDSTIELDPSISVPHRLWYAGPKLEFGYSPSLLSKEPLFDALPYTVPEPFIPGDSGPVTWTATFTASRPGVIIDWAWSAAAYSQFGVPGTLLLKPLSGHLAQADPQAGSPDLYDNDDPSGTAEKFKQYVIAGAMGNGAPQYTGTRSATSSVIACPTAPAPAPFGTGMFPYPQSAMVLRPVMTMWMRASEDVRDFASKVTQRLTFADGSVAQTVDRCFAFDLCARILYPDGGQLAIYSEGASYCEPFVLDFIRTIGGRTIYNATRKLDHDRPTPIDCGQTRTTLIQMEGGRLLLTIAKNRDGSLNFRFDARTKGSLR